MFGTQVNGDGPFGLERESLKTDRSQAIAD
jgi:hypothetical protein